MLPQYSPRRFDHRKSVGPATRAKQRRFRRDVCLITLLILLLTWWVIKYGFVANDDATVVQIQQSPNSQSSNDDKDKTSATEKTTDFSKNIPVTTGKNQGNEKSSSSTSSKTDNKNSGEDNSHSPLSSSSSTTSNPQETRESNLKKLIFSEIKNYLVLDAALDPSLIDKVQLQLAHVIFHNGKFWSAMDANDAATTKEGNQVKLVKDTIPCVELLLAYTISYCSAIIGHPYDPNDLKLIGRHFRAFTHIYSLAHDKQVIGQGSGYNVSSFPNFQKNVNQVIPDLVKQLFPWIKQEKIGFDDFRKSFTGRGIVYTTGGHHFNLAYHSIYCLRHILRSRLPVEVMYNGEHDLTSQQVTALEKISHVKAIDISSFYSKGGQDSVFEGWAIKPFAMLASSFQEMIFLDADVLFMQDPIVMFELEGYKRAGNVFFHDRQMNVGKADTHKWLETFMDPKTYSKDGEQVQFLKYGTIHEQDSGVVVINKGSSAFFGLLATCTMNRKLEREEIYKNVFGDKETFWIATELIKVPYYFPSGYGGTIGYVNPSKENSICGQLYHPDENWEPLWWNGGILKNKHFSRTNYLVMTHVATNKKGVVGEWDWEKEDTPFCYQPKEPKSEIAELSLQDKSITHMYIDTSKKIEKIIGDGGWKDLESLKLLTSRND